MATVCKINMRAISSNKCFRDFSNIFPLKTTKQNRKHYKNNLHLLGNRLIRSGNKYKISEKQLSFAYGKTYTTVLPLPEMF